MKGENILIYQYIKLINNLKGCYLSDIFGS